VRAGRATRHALTMWSRIGGEDRKRSAHARSATKSLTRFGLYLTCENGERAGERGPPWDGEIEISRGSPCVHFFSRDFCQPGMVPHGWRWLVACSLWLANSRASCTALRLSDKQIYSIFNHNPCFAEHLCLPLGAEGGPAIPMAAMGRAGLP